MSVVAEQVFVIGGPQPDTTGVSPESAGGKGANLARLSKLGLRVPPAIILGTGFCKTYFERRGFAPEFPRQVAGYLRRLEETTGRRLGGRHPLLVSVRSSPPVSMPGMLDTVLNVGLTESCVHALVRSTGNPVLAWDAYRRLVRSFAGTVACQPMDPFDQLTARYLREGHVERVDELDVLTLRSLSRDCAELFQTTTGGLPADPLEQVMSAVAAVCRSWHSSRATEYRRLHDIGADTATAVIIQAMVFGNGGGLSGSGVGFTRDPATGADRLYVDFLFNAQGEDVVSGRQAGSDAGRLRHVLPAVAAEIEQARRRLEVEFGDVQDFEFTVEDGRLFFLQTRTAKRTSWAALRIIVDLVADGIIEPAAAVARIGDIDLRTIQRRRLSPGPDAMPIGHGVPAGLGVASGAIALDVARARDLAAAGPVVLVRTEIATEDIAGLAVADGVVTTFGGPTSHGAVVARQMNKACVVGCRELSVQPAHRRCSFGGRVFHEGDFVTVDSETGNVYADRVPVVVETPQDLVATVEEWRSRYAIERSRVSPSVSA